MKLYTVRYSADWYLDGSDGFPYNGLCKASYANSPLHCYLVHDLTHRAAVANATLQTRLIHGEKNVYLKLTRNIAADEEILYPYSNSFNLRLQFDYQEPRTVAFI